MVSARGRRRRGRRRRGRRRGHAPDRAAETSDNGAGDDRADVMPSVVVVMVSVVRAVAREARSGQGEGGEDRHDDFLVVVRFITSSLSPLVGLTRVEATAQKDSDRGGEKKSHPSQSQPSHQSQSSHTLGAAPADVA